MAGSTVESRVTPYPTGNRLIDMLERKVREYFSKKAHKKRNSRMNGVY